MTNWVFQYTKNISLGILALAFCIYTIGQFPNTIIWNKLRSIENDTLLSYDQKLELVRQLKKDFEGQKLVKDSVYARILHRIGSLEYFINNKVATTNSILFTHAAIRINRAGKKNCAPAFCVNSYANLAMYYGSVHQYNLAAQYYDSALILKKQYDVPAVVEVSLLFDKAFSLYQSGDYQKAVEDYSTAILRTKTTNDTSLLISLLNQRAQSNLMMGQTEATVNDLQSAGLLLAKWKDISEATNNMLIQAKVLARRRDYSNALPRFYKAIKARIHINYPSQMIADDFTDLGNIYLNDLQNYSKAKACYLKTIQYASQAQDFEQLAKGHTNLEQCSYRQHNYKEAEHYCLKAMKDVAQTANDNIFLNPSLQQLSAVGNKELILTIMTNKTELLLAQYLATNKKGYLTSCLQTALLTDTLITHIRHEQLGEQSKLFWRNRTREFFTQALEACYLANDATLAFYFMEKSRAVLLNDQLNELGASAHLPKIEATRERELQVIVITEEQKLASLQNNDPEYEAQHAKLLQAKTNLEHYIKSLEANYPSYYQYKYADDVPSLPTLQNHLMKNKQSFVHYFMNDTVAYILRITPHSTTLVKLSKDKFNANRLVRFLQLCSDEIRLNNQYADFALLSDSLYKLLYQPLDIPKGRVVICPDNFLIPFEALCTDSAGNHFLINDYVFSYAYSARYLLKQFNTHEAKGNFVGFAPVAFKSYINIADLKLSDDALKHSAQHYSDSKLYTNNGASRQNFIHTITSYNIVNVFSHAYADTTVQEPVLYMHDSAIYLSELQLLQQPATQLAVLSACQTTAGKNAKGEGIFSWQEGFLLPEFLL